MRFTFVANRDSWHTTLAVLGNPHSYILNNAFNVNALYV